jgi:pilus assembly protein CpaB
MDRRRVLLVVATVVALVGTALVYLYVRGADDRAQSKFDAVNVLRVVAPITQGESIDDAQATGKLAVQPVGRDSLVPGYQTSIDSLKGQVAKADIYPGEQIIADQFTADAATIDTSRLDVPKGMIAVSVSLSDTGRVAGFISPGSHVAIFMSLGAEYTRLLLSPVEVIAIGSTTITQTTTTTPEGAQTTEALPSTLFTLALKQNDAEKVMYASNNGTLSFTLLSDSSEIKPDPGMTAAKLFR